MGYVSGIKLSEFINKFKNDYIDVILKVMLILMYANLRGYFHNDINMGNIIISEIDSISNDFFVNINDKIICLKFNNYVPVLIDYSFSKIIDSKNKFPIETYIMFEKFKKINLEWQYVSIYKKIDDFFVLMCDKYLLLNTSFATKIIFGSGVFSLSDYEMLPVVNNDDINSMIDLLT